MNFCMFDYGVNRITPIKSLSLPLEVRYKSNEKFTPPQIWNGQLYRIKARKFVELYCEISFESLQLNECEPYISGAFGFSEATFLVESKKGKICELSTTDGLNVAEFDLDVINSPKSIRVRDYYILMFQKDRAMVNSIGIGRKSDGDSKFSWKFQPTSTASGFALADDNKTLIVAEYKGGITALDVDTGSILWQKDVHT